MTRETKIGLLVGLAFIIVIGVLLSDHLTSATNPKMSSQMVGVGDQAYTSLVTPGGANQNKAVTIVPTGDVLPPEQVPTRSETSAPPAETGTARIDISPAPTAERRPTDIVADSRTFTTSLPPVRMIDGTLPGPVVAPPAMSVQTAAAAGATAAATPAVEKRQHKAQAGDTVSRMAYKYYGKNTRELRELIVRANPSLQRSPDRIVVGQSYVIPQAPSAAGQDSVAASIGSRTMMAAATTQPSSSAAADAVTVKTYTVKANDNLWRIATQECHDPNAVKAILALNKDVLKGTSKLQVGMKLKLPEKKVS